MMKNWKRCLSIAMTLAMLVGVLPTAAFAEEGIEPLSDPISVTDLTISLVGQTSEFTYNGSAPAFEVKSANQNITFDASNYDLIDNDSDTVVDIVNAGSYTVRARLKGSYSGTSTNSVSFTINPAAWDVKKVQVSNVDENGEYTYSGSAPTIKVLDENNNEVSTSQYTMTYKKGSQNVDALSKEVGSYSVTVTPKSNYTGTAITESFEITKKAWNVAEIHVPGADENGKYTYTGSAFDVEVRDAAHKAALPNDQYTVTCTKNGATAALQNAGTYTITVSPTDNYSGTAITKTLTIDPQTWEVNRVEVIGVDANRKITYTGTAPTVRVLKADGSDANTEQFTISYKKGTQSIDALSKDVGSYTVTVTPKPNYTGTEATGNSISVSYSIEPKELSAPWVADIDPITYDGTAHTPTPQVKESETGKTLVKDTDYTLSYSNNTNAGTAKVTVNLSENYKLPSGVKLEKSFTINRITISNPAVSVPNIEYGGTLAVSVTNNGTTVAAKDYTLTYAAADSETFTTSVPVNVGSYKVKATLSENYSGTPNSVVKPFSITGIAVANPSITVSGNLGYTGSAVVPVIEVKNDGKVVAAKDYTLTFYKAKSESEYEEITAAQLIAAGNYKVKATLGSNYTGSTKTVEQTFTIARKSISDAVVTFTESVFTESSYKNAKPSVKLGTKTLSLGVDYSLTYGDVNTTTHKATITVTGLGNYTGTVEKEVTISGGSDIAADILAAVDDTFDFDNKLTVLSLKSAYNTLTETEQKAVRDTVGTTVWNKFISRVNQKMYSLKNEPSRGYYTYTKGTSSNVVIEINADFDRTYVTEIRMGKNLTVIEPQHYEVKRGSVVVTLSSSYLKNIKTSGTYNLYIDLLDDSGYTETVQTKVYVRSATDIPQTGDPFKMNLWIGLLGASVLALAGLGVYEIVKKKKNAQKRLEAAMNLDEEPSDDANTNE